MLNAREKRFADGYLARVYRDFVAHEPTRRTRCATIRAKVCSVRLILIYLAAHLDLIARTARRLSLHRVTTESAFARACTRLSRRIADVSCAAAQEKENRTRTLPPRAHSAFIHSRGKPVFASRPAAVVPVQRRRDAIVRRGESRAQPR